MIPISCTTRAEVWLAAAKTLYASDERIHNLILEAKEPHLATVASREIERVVDAFLRKHKCQPLHTVAETIFPAVEYRQGGLPAVFAYPETIYPHIQSENPWGTYALRMTATREDKDGVAYNPLEVLIEKLRRQLALASPKRAAYEIGLMSEALDLTLYDADEDRTRVVAGQCLSHLSFKLGPNHELYLTALYRYQWFVQKALGNLLGLARLQGCIARELKVPVGPLVCHAALAVLEDTRVAKLPWKRCDLKELIDQCDAILSPDTSSGSTPSPSTAA